MTFDWFSVSELCIGSWRLDCERASNEDNDHDCQRLVLFDVRDGGRTSTCTQPSHDFI